MALIRARATRVATREHQVVQTSEGAKGDGGTGGDSADGSKGTDRAASAELETSAPLVRDGEK